ncbi:hypothetical protein IMCC3317_47090 [Kordia antarctica]|uniref:Uncharacterized protein n=1 Tax=Kordia antarctica TaxID=1218801 RepID=A0A7L4ZSC9_9FLAO|nr:hypothetical protein IMCC3317_47090 [Kordia antarctica]
MIYNLVATNIVLKQVINVHEGSYKNALKRTRYSRKNIFNIVGFLKSLFKNKNNKKMILNSILSALTFKKSKAKSMRSIYLTQKYNERSITNRYFK